MADDTYTIDLKSAVMQLQANGLGARIFVDKATDLILVADLTRPDFNGGQPVEIFHTGIYEGCVLRVSFDGAMARYMINKKAGVGLSEIHPMSILRRELA
jgi:hypothetical protein